MNIERITSGNIFRIALLLLATLTVVLMPHGQSLSLSSLTDIFTTIVVPVMAPILFVILLMDLIIYSATSDSELDKWQKGVMALEGLAAVLLLVQWLPYVLAPPA